MKTMFKTTVYTLLMIAAIFVATVIIINLSLFDQQPDPGVTALIPIAPPPVVEANAYYAVMGLSAAKDMPIIDAGAQLIERYKHNRKQGEDVLSSNDFHEILGVQEADKPWQDRYERCKAVRENGCLKKLSQQLKTNPVDDPRLALMLHRYDSIMQLTTFKNFNDVTIGTPVPAYSVLMSLSQLKLADLYNSGPQADFLEQIKIDLAFWKMQMVEGLMLVDKMVAIAAIWSDLQYLSEFIASREISEQEHFLIDSVLVPFKHADLDVSSAFASEARSTYRWVNSISVNSLELKYMLLQPNATMNLYYRYLFEPMAELSHLSAAEFIKAKRSTNYRQRGDVVASLISYTPDSLYNYGGKVLFSGNWCKSCDVYIARGHDLNGLINLVKLQLIIKTTAGEDVHQSISNSGIKNPYTNEAYDFDARGNWLQFVCLDKALVCRIKL